MDDSGNSEAREGPPVPGPSKKAANEDAEAHGTATATITVAPPVPWDTLRKEAEDSNGTSNFRIDATQDLVFFLYHDITDRDMSRTISGFNYWYDAPLHSAATARVASTYQSLLLTWVLCRAESLYRQHLAGPSPTNILALSPAERKRLLTTLWHSDPVNLAKQMWRMVTDTIDMDAVFAPPSPLNAPMADSLAHWQERVKCAFVMAMEDALVYRVKPRAGMVRAGAAELRKGEDEAYRRWRDMPGAPGFPRADLARGIMAPLVPSLGRRL